MFNLIAKPKSDTTSPWNLQFVKNNTEILRLLMLSKETGQLVGVYSPVLGEGMFLTKVETIHMESMHDDKIVVLNRYDMSGHILATTRVALSEIRIVCPFNQQYKNPVLALNAAVYSQ